MLIIVRIVTSLVILLLTLFGILCGFSWYIAPEAVRIVTVSGFDLYLFAPFAALSKIMDHGFMAFIDVSWQCLVVLAVGSLAGLLVAIVAARIIRLFANPTTTLHGSARWATIRDLRRAGLIKPYGLVLGQTAKAVYRQKRAKKPKRKRGESRSDYQMRLDRWDPKEVEYVLGKPGQLITQSKNNHTLIVGSTRSGKGVSVLIPTTFQWPESLIIMDPKAESWGISANHRAKFSYTFKFQPERPDESIHYNPLLSIRRGRQTIPDIQNLAGILIPDNPQAKDPFWDMEARKLFTAVCGYVVYCEPPERKTFAQIASIFTNYKELEESEPDPDEEGLLMVKRYLKHYVRKLQAYVRDGRMPEELRGRWSKYEEERKKAEASGSQRRLDSLKKTKEKLEAESQGYLDDEDVRTLRQIEQDLVYFSECEDKQLSSTLSTMTSRLTVIADPNVQAVTDRSDFNMSDFVYGITDEKGQRHPLSLYLCVSLSSMQRLVPLLKIFYEQAITLLTRELDPKRPYRLLLIFDEFYQMGRMDIVTKALALSAGYGIICAVAIQSYDQLKLLYDSESVFIDNFAYQVVLRVNDESTCAKIERILGQSTEKHTSMSFSGQMGQIVHSGENVQTTIMGRSLMTAEEIRTMPENDCLIISSGEPPYRGRKIRYYMDPRFIPLFKDRRGRALPPPPIAENYPHPEAIEGDLNHGVDDEGWFALKGASSYGGSYEEAAEEPAGKVPADREDGGRRDADRSGNYIEDSVNEVHEEEEPERSRLSETARNLLRELNIEDYEDERPEDD